MEPKRAELSECLRVLALSRVPPPTAWNPSNRVKLWKVRTCLSVLLLTARVFLGACPGDCGSVVARFSGGGMVIQPRER